VTIARIGFAYNPTNDAAVELRERAAGWCRMHGIDQWAAQAQDFDQLCRELATTDALVVLGGDGTFLRAARAVIQVDVPLLGVNLGKVGFLSKGEAGELDADRIDILLVSPERFANPTFRAEVLPQIAARVAIQEIDTPYGRLRFAGSGFRLAHGGGRLDTMAPELGAHTDEVLHSIGYDTEAIADLRSREIV